MDEFSNGESDHADTRMKLTRKWSILLGEKKIIATTAEVT